MSNVAAPVVDRWLPGDRLPNVRLRAADGEASALGTEFAGSPLWLATPTTPAAAASLPVPPPGVIPLCVGAAAPAHCKVSGVLSPEIAFEVSLPAKWNGRFYMIGNGGHAGESLEDPGRVAQKNQALQLGFAFAQTNTGHDARKEPGASFVLSNPQKAIDYAYRAVHLTALTSKDITKDYYGRAASKSC